MSTRREWSDLNRSARATLLAMSVEQMADRYAEATRGRVAAVRDAVDANRDRPGQWDQDPAYLAAARKHTRRREALYRLTWALARMAGAA